MKDLFYGLGTVLMIIAILVIGIDFIFRYEVKAVAESYAETVEETYGIDMTVEVVRNDICDFTAVAYPSNGFVKNITGATESFELNVGDIIEDLLD